jgi:hypothetical protein
VWSKSSFFSSRGPQAHTSRAATVGSEAMSEAVVRVRGASDATGASFAIRACLTLAAARTRAYRGRYQIGCGGCGVSRVCAYTAQGIGGSNFSLASP